jgi:hypothetical protein
MGRLSGSGRCGGGFSDTLERLLLSAILKD